MRRQISRPSIPGIIQSSTARRGAFSDSRTFQASVPLRAVTAWYPHLVSIVLSIDWNTGLSSAARTRMGGAEATGASDWMACSPELVVNGFIQMLISAGGGENSTAGGEKEGGGEGES